MSTSRKFLFGGLGALVPILLSLLVIDLETQLFDVKALAICSYVVRTIALFAIGGLVVTVFNRDENSPAKLFQLGIVAPALLTTAINGKNVTVPGTPKADGAKVALIHVPKVAFHLPELIATAYAGEPSKVPDEMEPKAFSVPSETASQQISRGFFGTVPSNIWYVIAGSQKTQAEAERQALALRKRGFEADVYMPFGTNPWWAVVIGAQMSQADARRLQAKAIDSGLPGDTYLWPLPGYLR